MRTKYRKINGIFSDIKLFELKLNSIDLSIKSIEELNSLIDPQYFRKGIEIIDITFDNFFELSTEFFDNINIIKPNILITRQQDWKLNSAK